MMYINNENCNINSMGMIGYTASRWAPSVLYVHYMLHIINHVTLRR